MNKVKRIKLKFIADIFNGNSISDDKKSEFEGKEIPYIPTKELSVLDGAINYENGLSVDRTDGFRIAPPESVLMCIEGGSAGRKIGFTDRSVAFVNKLCCLYGTTIDHKFLYYALHSKDFTDQFFLNMTGLIGGVTVSVLKNLLISVPGNQKKQKVISEFLDEKCNQIDTLIANVQTQIEKLKAYKQSLITEVVTKGLDPSVPMKDSGVEWIGEIPEHWYVVKARRIIISTQNGMTRRDLSESEGHVVLKLKNISADGDIDYSYINRINLTEKEIETYSLKDGDFLFVRVNGSKGLVGKCAIFADNGAITAYNDHIIRVRINELCSKKYFYYYLFSRAGKTEIEHHTSTSAGQYTISGEGLRDVWLVLPPKDMQDTLCSFLDKKCTQIERLITIKQDKIEKLEQYKRSLIYEYVTGKKEVS